MFNGTYNKLSILIKTFNRKGALLRLLRSLEKLNCPLPILIADDSQQPYQQEVISSFAGLNIQYHILPFDAGLAAGRNHLLKQVSTDYFLLCDDDFVFSRDTGLSEGLAMVQKHDLDIGGGTFLNYTSANNIRKIAGLLLKPTLLLRVIKEKPIRSAYIGNFKIENNSCTLFITNHNETGNTFHPCDCVNNFFIGKTSAVQKINGWDETFKVGEHEDFFYRARKNGLKTAFLENFSIRHYPVSNKTYLQFRERSFELKKEFLQKHGFCHYSEINADTGETIFECGKESLLTK